LSEDDKKTSAELKDRFMFFRDQFQVEVTVQIFMNVRELDVNVRGLDEKLSK